tara:strand:+ start:394 stop:633 length:240 start_codon:yes stop_codon:yes gene_type:complete
MKTLKDIKKGFETFDVQKVQLNKLTYFFTDYRDMKIKSFNGSLYVGRISRYNDGFEMGEKWYTNQNKFESAIKRHLAKQ